MLLHEPYFLSLLGLMLVTTAVTWILPPPAVSMADAAQRPRAVARMAATQEGTLQSLDVDDRSLVLASGDQLKKFSISSTVAVTRDSKEIEISMLAEGDFVVLTFASESKELVTRIQAISRR